MQGWGTIKVHTNVRIILITTITWVQVPAYVASDPKYKIRFFSSPTPRFGKLASSSSDCILARLMDEIDAGSNMYV
jgi:hypothetical protein